METPGPTTNLPSSYTAAPQNEAWTVWSELSTWSPMLHPGLCPPASPGGSEGRSPHISSRLRMPEITLATEDSLYTTTLKPGNTVQRPQGPGIENPVAREHEWQGPGTELKHLPCPMCLA